MIEIIGSLDQQTHYDDQQIRDLFTFQQTELSYGSAFVGRPSTRLYVSDTTVVKLRTELDLNELRAKRFIHHTLTQEQQLNIHHPHKTWFLLKEEQTCKIGNICPRLTPLHTLEITAIDTHHQLSYLNEIYQHYFHIAVTFQLRLDEGLANFGIDDLGKLYYLDDDLYSWDHFISFAHSLGVLIRNNAWLTEHHAQLFGNYLQQLISQYFGNDTNIMVARTLSDIYMPNNDKQKILNLIIKQLQQQKVISKTVSTPKQEFIAILADIHANLPALDAVLAYLKQHNIQQGMVLGDIVGYGPYPSECIDRLRETDFLVIKGNHDHAAATGDSNIGMSKLATWCIDWTIPRLNVAQRQWLNDLPLELTGNDEQRKWQAVHGSPIDPNYFYAYVYQMTYEENLNILAERNIDFCFHGHSHIQGLYTRTPIGLDNFNKPQETFSLAPYKHALICPGSIGQPRDGSVSAQFAIYHQHKHELHFITVDYPIETTIKTMQDYQFPENLWRRLLRGT